MRKFFWAVLLIVALLGVLSIGVIVGPLVQSLLGLNLGPRQINATVILDRVQQLSDLTTARYNFSSLVTSQRDMPGPLQLLYGERLALVAVGHVIAGVDLGALTAADVAVEGNRVTLRLPAARLLDCFLDEGASYVVQRDTGVFTRTAADLESSARQFAIQQFKAYALEDGILVLAQDQARLAVEELIGLAAGDAAVEVTFAPADAAQPEPATCAPPAA